MKKRNVGRLVMEFLVISIGVLAALAVDNWNDTRKDLILEKEYLLGIAEDLQADIDTLATATEAAQSNELALRTLIEVIRTGEAPAPEVFIKSLIFSTYLGLPRTSPITFNELVSTGSLRLIRDNRFKRQLSEYYAQDAWQLQWHPEYRRKESHAELALRGLLPLEHRLGWDNLESTAAPKAFDSQKTVDELRRRDNLADILEDMVWVQNRVLRATRDLTSRAHDLLAVLEKQGITAPGH